MQNVRIGSHSVHQLHVYLVWCANRKVIAQKADTTKDKEAIKQLVTNYKSAWNRHDSKGLADSYDTNATWVNWFGTYYIGKKDIQDHYKAVHTTYFKNSHDYTSSI